MASGERPLVSALLPAHNAAGLIGETLESLAAQTWPALEILIGDDASTDATPEMLASFAARHANVRLTLRRENLGWIGNTNALMAEARGTYLFFAFHDDLWEPRFVETMVGLLEAEPRAVLAYSDALILGQNGHRGVGRLPAIPVDAPRVAHVIAQAARPSPWWAAIWGVFRADAARAVGGLRVHRGGELSADWPFLLRLSGRGAFLRHPEIMVTKRIQERSLIRQWRRSAEEVDGVNADARAAIREMDLGRIEALRAAAALWFGRPQARGTLSGLAHGEIRIPARIRRWLLHRVVPNRRLRRPSA